MHGLPTPAHSKLPDRKLVSYYSHKISHNAFDLSVSSLHIISLQGIATFFVMYSLNTSSYIPAYFYAASFSLKAETLLTILLETCYIKITTRKHFEFTLST